MEASFDVVYESDKSYHFLLQFSNLSFEYADIFDRKRDETFIEQRMQAIKAELAPLLKDASWEVFAVDEVRMDQEAVIRKAGLRKVERFDNGGIIEKRDVLLALGSTPTLYEGKIELTAFDWLVPVHEACPS